MRRSRVDSELRARLEGAAVPDEAGAEARAWDVVREAYAQRQPAPPRPAAGRGVLVALAGAATALAIGLSPAGARVSDLVADVGEAMGIGVDDARPALRSLPAAGELLVRAEDGIWIVREDGSKRRLGEYSDAAWSPRGRYVVAAAERELVALDPEGEVRWSVPTRTRAADPRWGGTDLDTRIAYRVGRELHVVAGDGTEDRIVADDSARSAPRWLEWPGLTKVAPQPPHESELPPAAGFPLFLAYLDRRGEPRAVDPETGAQLDLHLGRAQRLNLSGAAVSAPTGARRAAVSGARGRSTIRVSGGGERRVVFSGPGRLSQPVWSPDGRWLLFAWREADQWLFAEVDGRRRVVAVDRVGRAFANDLDASAPLPQPLGWVLPQR